MTVTQ